MPFPHLVRHDRAAMARGQDIDDILATIGAADEGQISHFRQYRAPCPPKEATNI
jgi:hypothetical protein